MRLGRARPRSLSSPPGRAPPPPGPAGGGPRPPIPSKRARAGAAQRRAGRVVAAAPWAGAGSVGGLWFAAPRWGGGRAEAATCRPCSRPAPALAGLAAVPRAAGPGRRPGGRPSQQAAAGPSTSCPPPLRAALQQLKDEGGSAAAVAAPVAEGGDAAPAGPNPPHPPACPRQRESSAYFSAPGARPPRASLRAWACTRRYLAGE